MEMSEFDLANQKKKKWNVLFFRSRKIIFDILMGSDCGILIFPAETGGQRWCWWQRPVASNDGWPTSGGGLVDNGSSKCFEFVIETRGGYFCFYLFIFFLFL